MKPTVAIIAPGRMGSAIATRLTHHGLEIRTILAGRSESSAARARDAGMRDGDEAWIASSDILLSVVPPAEAVRLAQQLAEPLARAKTPPVYVDLNAIAPRTATEVEAAIIATGVEFVDGCIIGTVPRGGYAGPFLYLSGKFATKASVLSQFGLNVEVLDGPVGAASALKMCFAAIMKGFQAIGCTSFLAAARSGVAPALCRELGRSQPQLMAWFDRQIPAMYPKTYRWVAEMQEIAEFLDGQEGRDIYLGASRLFAHLSDGSEESGRSLGVLKSLF